MQFYNQNIIFKLLMQRLFTAIIVLLFLFSGRLQAQDPQFSQFYAAPVYLNPALTGSTELTRVGMNYRNQWPAIDANFVTYSAYFDHYLRDYNSGIGLLVVADREGLAGLKNTYAALDYSYQVHLSSEWAMRAGLEGSYVFRSLDFGRLVFSDQLDFTGIVNNTTQENFNSDFNINYFDLAAGAMLHNRNLWVGFAAHHLLTPNQSLINDSDPLPRKFSIHAGYKIPLNTNNHLPYSGRDISITPTALYKWQGDFSQFDMGMYLTYEPMVFGISYRGIPIKSIDGVMNNESVIMIVGITTNGLNIGYSYDVTVSKLGFRSGGAHELSISYEFFMGDPRKPPKNVRKLPCPRF